MRTTISGIQKAQQANEKLISELRPGGAFSRAIQYATVQAHRYVVTITHVVTGALRASHRMRVARSRGQIYIDPAAVNPGGQKPAVYGVIEHDRGGQHAFYYRTVNESGRSVARAAASAFIRELPA